MEVFLEHFTGIKPKDRPGWAGDYSSSSQDVPRAGRSAEGKGHLNQFLWADQHKLWKINGWTAFQHLSDFSFHLFRFPLMNSCSRKWQITPGNIPRVTLYCFGFFYSFCLFFFSLVYLMVHVRSLKFYFGYFFKKKSNRECHIWLKCNLKQTW